MAKRVSRRDGDIDKKLDSNERMTWIEEGGIDLRAAREPVAKAARGTPPSPAPKPKRQASKSRKSAKPAIRKKSKPATKIRKKKKAPPKNARKPKGGRKRQVRRAGRSRAG